MHEQRDHDGAHEHDEIDYRGSAVLFTAEMEVTAGIVLRGHFQPIDGRFHWYGRVNADERMHELTGGRKKEVVVRTPHGQAPATLGDPDPWGRYRITGLGRPPFPVETDPSELETAG